MSSPHTPHPNRFWRNGSSGLITPTDLVDAADEDDPDDVVVTADDDDADVAVVAVELSLVGRG